MQDRFSSQPTRIRGKELPDAERRRALQHDLQRGLEALDRLCAAAAQCGVGADPIRDLVVLAEDEVSLLEGAGGEWAELGDAIRAWRKFLPLRRLEDFGFPAEAENPLEEANSRLRRIGVGVEAWAFASEEDASVYKFYFPGEEQRIGSTFDYRPGEESAIWAHARWGDYRGLLEKLIVIQALGGMATEAVALTPEGILVAKQVLGEPLTQGEDMSARLPLGLIEIPSRFLRANRDHPRLFFLSGRPFLVADLHARNFVRGRDGQLYVIDLVAGPWPEAELARIGMAGEWLARVRTDPGASMLIAAADDEL